MSEYILVRCGKHSLTFPTIEAWISYYEEFRESFGEQDVKVYHVQLTEITNNLKF